MRCGQPGCEGTTCMECGNPHDSCKCEAIAAARALLEKDYNYEEDFPRALRIIKDLLGD